jgi:hypothetical protein
VRTLNAMTETPSNETADAQREGTGTGQQDKSKKRKRLLTIGLLSIIDPFSELLSGHFFRWLSLNRWRAIVDQKQSGNSLVLAKSG